VGLIKVSFNDIDLSKFESKTDSDGNKIYRINVALHIALGAKDGTLVCKLLLRGREIGKTTIDFSYR